MTLLVIFLGIVSSVLVCGMYLLRRRSDPYSIAVTCVPMLLLPIFFTSMLGERIVIHGFKAMAQTGTGMEEIVSGLEVGNRLYFIGHAASVLGLIALLVVAIASLLRSEATTNRSSLRNRIVVAVAAISTAGALTVGSLESRSIVHPLVGMAAVTQQDVSNMPITREAQRALQAELTDPSALARRSSRNMLIQAAAAFVCFWLSVLGFVASIVLGRGTGMARPVAVFGLTLTAVAAVVVSLQAHRHYAIGDEIAQLANIQGIHQRQY